MDEQCEDVSHNIAQTHSPYHLKSLPKYQHQPGRNIEVRRRGREIHNMKKNVRKTHTQIQLRVQTLQRWAITLLLPHPPFTIWQMRKILMHCSWISISIKHTNTNLYTNTYTNTFTNTNTAPLSRPFTIWQMRKILMHCKLISYTNISHSYLHRYLGQW